MQENEKYESLLKYEQGKLFMEEINLGEALNMCELSIANFFCMLPSLLNSYTFIGYDILNNGEVGPYSKEATSQLLVKREEYKAIKKLVFDFAYISCSNFGKANFNRCAVENSGLLEAIMVTNRLRDEMREFHTIYQLESGDYNVMGSNVFVDDVEYQKVYSIFNRK